MKKFYRIKNNSILGGICTGIANYINYPELVWLIRLLFIWFSFSLSIAIFIYLILMFTDEKEY